MKRKTMKRACSMLLAAVLAMGMTGCGDKGKTNDGDDNGNKGTTKDSVTLEWYYAGNGIQTDTQKVEDRVNELLKNYEGLEHVKIHMNCFLGDEYAQQVQLAQTAGKQIDILHSYKLDYSTEVSNGTYLALDEYLDSDEFSGLKKELPEWLWQTLQVDGKTYIVPGYQMGASDRYLFVPTEYAQYADSEKLASLSMYDKDDIIEVCSEIEKITLAVQEGTGKTKYCYPLGLNVSEAGNFLPQDVIDRSSGFVMRSGSDKIINLYLDECFKEACRIAAEWVQKGYLPKDAAVQDYKAWDTKNMLNENAFAVSVNQSYGSEEHVAEVVGGNWGMEVQAYRLHENYFMQNGWGAGGNGVTASCKHPEEALKFIEALNTEKGKEIYNTIVYGLEGTHYKKVNDKRIETLEYDGGQGLSETSYAAWKWVIGNTKYAYLNQSTKDDEMDIVAEINENPNNVVSDMMGFRVNLEPVSTEVSQCAAVVTEYKNALIWGSKGADWEAYYNEFVDKMEAAGASKVAEEIQSQYDAWRK